MVELLEPTLADLEQLAELFDAYRRFYNKMPDLEGAKRFLQARIMQEDSVIYMAKDTQHHKPVGFVQLYPLFSSTRMCRLWLLNDLYVMPEYRGRGISIQLIDRAKMLAKSTEAVGLLLETEKSNTIGNHLYPRTGFEVDEDHNYYFWVNAG